MTQFIPSNLDVDNLVKDHPPYEIKQFSKDKLIYLLYLLHSIPANNKHLKIVDGYVPIHSKIIKRCVCNYRQYLNYLLRVEILETDNHFVKGKKSKCYRFKPTFQTTLKPVRITNRALCQHQKAERRICRPMKKSAGHLIKWFNEDLKIDYEAALDFIAMDLNRKLKNPTLCEIDPKTRKAKNPYTQYNASYINIERIAAGEFHLSIDNNVNRFHSNITNLRSDLRHFLTYEGKQLCSVDMKNSQPYISTILLQEDFWSRQGVKSIISIKDIDTTSINKHLFIQEYISYISYIMCLKSNGIQASTDLERFVQLVTDGMFYEHMEKLLSEQLGSKYANRKAVKAVLFQVLYSDNRYIGQDEAAPKRLFRDNFPTVYNFFALIKQGDHTKLPRLLQQIESHLMIKQVTRRIAKEKPNLPIFTIHDSIATTVGNEAYIKAVIEEELLTAIGHKPIVRLEYWRPSALSANDKKLFIGDELIAA